MFILGIPKHHGTICPVWIFNVQCSFSMGYITPAINITPRQLLSSPPPQNKNEWVHLVIFELQLKIQLTQSSYKVTSFLDFQPFLRHFQSVNEYLKDLTRDINNPDYFQRIVSPFSNFQITLLSNESIIWKFLNSPACRVNPYGCKSKIKLEHFFYQQIKGAAMGSPVSPIVANIFMEAFEARALATALHPPKLWRRYVDDTCVIQDQSHKEEFLQHINSVDNAIKFTTEEAKEDGSIPFLDTLITPKKNGTLSVGVYRKPTHTDLYLPWDSNHHLSAKYSVIKTLTHRAHTIC